MARLTHPFLSFTKFAQGAKWGIRFGLVLGLLLVAFHPWILERIALSQFESTGGKVLGARSISYQQIQWESLTWSDDTLVIQLDRLDLGLLPTLFRSWLSFSGDNEPVEWFATAENLKIEVSTTESPKGETTAPTSLPFLHQLALKTMRKAELWLPPVQVKGIELQEGKNRFKIGTIVWQQQRLYLNNLIILLPQFPWSNFITQPSQIEFERIGDGFQALAKIQTTETLDQQPLSFKLLSNGTEQNLEAKITLDGKPGSLRAEVQWDGNSLIPKNAQAEGSIIHLSPTITQAGYQAQSIEFKGFWEDGTYQLNLLGEGIVLNSKQPSPLTTNLILKGDLKELALEAMTIQLPGVEAVLNDPIRINLETLSPQNDALLTLQLELDEIPSLSAKGQINLELQIEAQRNAEYQVNLQGKANSLVVGATTDKELNLGNLDLSLRASGSQNAVTLETFALESEVFGSAEGRGQWNRASAEEFSSEAQVTLKPEAASLLPALENLQTSSSQWQIDASFTEKEWRIAGTLEGITLTYASIPPVYLQGEWESRRTKIEFKKIQATFEQGSKISLTGTVDLQDGQTVIGVDSLDESFNSQPRWSLQTPLTVNISSTENGPKVLFQDFEGNTKDGARISISKIEWSPSDWSGEVFIDGLFPSHTRGWLPSLPEQWAVEKTIARGRLQDQAGQWKFDGALQTNLTWTSTEGDVWQFNLESTASQNRLEIETFEVGSSKQPWLALNGSIPFSLGPTSEPVAPSLEQKKRLLLRAHLTAKQSLPPFFARKLPIQTDQIEAKLSIDGSFAKPLGTFQLDGHSIGIAQKDGNGFLQLRSPKIQASFAEDRLEISQWKFKLEEAGPTVSLIGHLDLIESDAQSFALQESLLNAPMYFSGEEIPLKAIERFLPDFLQAAGSLSFELHRSGNGRLFGSFICRDLATTSLSNNTQIREIGGTARIEGFRLENLKFQGVMGGRNLGINGWLDFADFKSPLFNLKLQAERLDLVRQIDLIFRAGGNISIVKESQNSTPLIEGTLVMGESLLLRDLRDFTRLGVSSRSRRPPYFSIDDPVFSPWLLDLNIEGDNFLRIRTTVFEGLLSGSFHLTGSLGDPLLVGTASIDQGQVLFPFGRLQTSRLTANIPIEDPHSLKLNGSAQGRTFGYGVQMQIAGTGNDPEVTFTSVPSLRQEEIILMLAAGAVPSSEAGSGDAAVRAGQIALYLGKDFFSDWIGSGDGASNLEIRSTEGFSSIKGDGKILEYHLSEDTSILGEYDEFGDYNLDFKWNLYRK